MSKLLKRMEWYKIPREARLWVVWFLLLVGAGTVLEFTLPETYKASWIQWVGLAVVFGIVAKIIVGPEKKKSNEEEE